MMREAIMPATDPQNSVEYWRRVSCRWKVIAIGAMTTLVLVVVLGGVALVVESSAKFRAFEQIEQMQNEGLVDPRPVGAGGFRPNGGFPGANVGLPGVKLGLRDREAVERAIQVINAAGKKQVQTQRW
jgi:hypothetical protein